MALRKGLNNTTVRPNPHKAELKIGNWKVQIYKKRQLKNHYIDLYLQGSYDFRQYFLYILGRI